jgi:SH3 domain-containing YSC84-like protein 1
MTRYLRVALATFLAAAFLASATAVRAEDKAKVDDRLRNSGQVMSEILNMPDSIPQSVLDRTKCVIVVPSVLKAAFVVGAAYGRGAMVCRTGHGFTGPWGAPSMVALEGGSFGLQIGGQATDFVFLVMNDRGAHSILHSKVKLGGDISAAAGPVGRDAEADTDVYMRAEILTYSRARGVFAGLSLEGSTLRPDNDGNEALYGHPVSAVNIVFAPGAHTPEAARRLDLLLDKASPHLKTA